jgi:hypothetical protein
MITTQALINTQYIKDNTVVQQLMDNFLFDPFITIAQDLYIKPILGVNLYNQVISAVTANSGLTNNVYYSGDTSGGTSGYTSGISQNYVDLINEIKLPLAHYTLYDCFPYLNYKLTKIGVERRSGNNLEPVQVQELSFLRKDVLERAKSLGELLKTFLKDNASTYAINDTCSINSTSNLGGCYFKRR